MPLSGTAPAVIVVRYPSTTRITGHWTKGASYLLVNSARMQGFIIRVTRADFRKALSSWPSGCRRGGEYAETWWKDLKTPQGFIGLFTGENLGKQIVNGP